ncbi:MAG: DNA-directed RNA polymerase subunit beta [Bacilli bacterium]|nr:DNA-directed RNA polymerase subunit beta [Bacilli bacterium]
MTRNIADLKKLNNDRIDYSRVSGKLPLPNLVEIQTKSYEEFKEKGLDEVFRESFPIYNYTETLSIDYVSVRYGEPKHSFLECKAQDLTYSVPIYVTLRLTHKESGEIQESEVYMGEFPLMTKSGTFIVNGAERVIVSQLVRSPGAYLSKEMKAGKYLYEADLIPGRGTWLQFESDSKDILSVRIDRQRKMHATVFLRALGFENDEDIIKLFGHNEALENTLAKDDDLKVKTAKSALIDIFKKMKPGEPVTEEGTVTFLVQKFFDAKRYDLGRAGRYKYIKKLGIYNRLAGRTLAENLVSADGELRFKKGYTLTAEDVDALRNEDFFEQGAHLHVLNINTKLDTHGNVNIVKVYNNEKDKKVCPIIGTDLNSVETHVTISDIAAVFSYFLNVMEGFGSTDDIDHLGNRRIRCVGELIQNQFRIGLGKMVKTVQQKMSISDLGNVKPKALINPRPLTASIREFFASSQLSQFMDQTNPLAELTNKRRLSALGPGGLTRDRASSEVRDVHVSHYGRICPIETPEGQNIGLINNLASYAKVNKYGFVETPYRKVDKSDREHPRILNEAEDSVYLSADEEWNYVIAEANINIDENGVILDDQVVARFKGENVMARKEDVDFVDVSPKQIVSIAAGSIPFLENDDTMRALMGSNMQRQALPLLKPHAPFVGTGLEHQIARDSGLAVVASEDGVVTYTDSRTIEILEKGETEPRVYELQKFQRSNQGTCMNQVSIVKVGQKVKKGDIIADGPAMENGDLALGQNVTIAFMTWNGYNYEDAVIMSERLVKDDVYTTIHIEKYELECRSIPKLGDEEITADIPNVSAEAKAHLDERGIIIPGTEVKEGDILVGKVTPRGLTEPSPEEKLLMAIFGEKTNEGKDASLRVPHGGAGIVLDVKIFKREGKNKDVELPPGVNEVVRVYIVQKRKISEGDKMSGRHGNKGVISRILPECDMPFLPDGTPVDIMLNPLGVPSRMNIGQILEVHLGYALKQLGYKIATPVFDGITNEEIFDMMEKAKMAKDGKTVLYDGQTGERFDERITVGCMYMIKLVHMVDDKLHARATGPYSLVTQQPLGGKAQNGGQRFGEMEVWALEAYGAAHVLQEIITVKSDDRVGRRKTYEAIIKGQTLPKPGIPEAFKVLVKELQALSMNVELLDQEGNVIDMDVLAKEAEKEERRINSNIRNLVGEGSGNAESVVDQEAIGMSSKNIDEMDD